MTNDQLRAFTSVVEQGSFRAAAVHLHKTQPTLSAAVRALEQKFNFMLFNRESYRPKLTTEGKAFYRQAKHLLSQAQQLEQLGHELSQRALPTLSICLNAVYAKPSDLESIQHFCTQNPDITLNISSAHLHGTVMQLDQEHVDLAIGARYGLDDRHEFFELSSIEMITVASPKCQGLVTGKRLSQNTLHQYPHVLTSSSSLTPTEHINVLPLGQRWYVNDYQIKKALLIAGMGWARIPKHMIETELEDKRLVPLEVENFNFRSEVPIYLIKRRHQVLSAIADKFWNYMLNKQ